MSEQKMSVCLWFDKEAEEAALFYTSIFKDSAMGKVSRYGKEGFEFHGQPEGTVMVATFTLNGREFMALNGGPIFRFSEAISIVVNCDTQEEIDHYWEQLTAGGEESSCGWLKDKFGVSWQVVPTILGELMIDNDPAKVQRVTKAFLHMKKFNIEKLKAAYDQH